MFEFLKKLFGGDPETNKEAGVQIEQVPYKTEPPVLVDKVAAVNAQPVEKPVQEAPKAEVKPAKKPATKKAAPKKEPAKKPATRGRKPKAK
jgi:hypothetical protein